MYNGGGFNKLRYNVLSSTELEFNFVASFSEKVDSLINHSEDAHEVVYAIDQFNGSTYATSGVLVNASPKEETHGDIKGYPACIFLGTFSDALSARTHAIEDSYIAHEISEIIINDVYIGKNVSLSPSLASVSFETAAFASVDYYDEAKTLTEIVDSTIGSVIFAFKYINIDVSMPPGSVLVIDSENYNVLLGNENVIDKHSGDWLDELSRSVYDITLVSGVSGKLSGKLLYTERYL